MDRPDALPTMLWRAVCTLSLLVFGGLSSAQWEALPRDSLIARLDPEQRTVEQAWVLSHLAGTWFVSPRSIPYLQRLDGAGRLVRRWTLPQGTDRQWVDLDGAAPDLYTLRWHSGQMKISVVR